VTFLQSPLVIIISTFGVVRLGRAFARYLQQVGDAKLLYDELINFEALDLSATDRQPANRNCAHGKRANRQRAGSQGPNGLRSTCQSASLRRQLGKFSRYLRHSSLASFVIRIVRRYRFK
jgi:hypothetical protein